MSDEKDFEDGHRIGGMEVLVLPDWILRRLGPGRVALLLPAQEAQSIRSQLVAALGSDWADWPEKMFRGCALPFEKPAESNHTEKQQLPKKGGE